ARDTANGHLQFLQLVGLTDEEMEAVKRWSTRGVLQALQPQVSGFAGDVPADYRPLAALDATLGDELQALDERASHLKQLGEGMDSSLGEMVSWLKAQGHHAVANSLQHA
ncbi:suppressor of fused domain protein, partial [Stenotrophomonas sp. 3diitr2024]|uniref:suppressor of fused domain protein n=1 Tax=Stenotrophomonas sp. 3diitr2024 TaxID=3345115 RepID=UPI0035CA5394